MTEPRDPDVRDLRYDTAAIATFGANVAAFWQALRSGGMKRSEATDVTIAWVEATVGVWRQQQEDVDG